MAIQSPPWTLQAASHGAELFRRTTQSLIAGTGIVGSGDLLVTQNGTPNMSVNVAAGQVWIPGTLGGTSAINLTNLGQQSAYGLPTGLTTQGSYYALNDATVNLAISAANPTLPRIDLVVASVQDSFYSGSTNTVVLQVITGTAASSPSPPSPPANSVVLAQVAVAANATSITTGNITDERPILAVSGGVACVNGAGNLPATRNFVKLQSGTFTSTFSSVNSTSGTLTYPVAFAAAPVIASTVMVAGNLDIFLNWQTISATAVTWRLIQKSGTNVSGTVTVSWIAIGT